MCIFCIACCMVHKSNAEVGFGALRIALLGGGEVCKRLCIGVAVQIDEISRALARLSDEVGAPLLTRMPSSWIERDIDGDGSISGSYKKKTDIQLKEGTRKIGRASCRERV